MKKLICLLLCLILLVSAVPALAASLTPEDVIGTWELYYLNNNGQVMTAKDLKTAKISQTYQFHADGTGKSVLKDRFGSDTRNMVWKIQGNTVRLDYENNNGYIELKKMGKDLGVSFEFNSGNTLTSKFRKTKDTTGKKVKTAILSTGTYSLNNGRKTAALTAPAKAGASALKIPDTIYVNGKNYKVTEISTGACSGMTKLTTLTLGANIKTIGAGAFAGCTSLKKITFTGTALSKAGANAFTDAKAKATVTCPKAKIAKYQKLLKKAGLTETAKFKAK
ncbi:MAG: leucine-rich repeat protein [Clostridia bacterium]|nr:leucine-rich repeat protein [Clostridia bacterium]